MRNRHGMKAFIIVVLLLVSQTNPPALGGRDKASGLVFNRKNEPKEEAFSILVPQDWRIEGGMFRVNPLQAGGPLNSMEAKCDMTLKSDPEGTISFRILPDIVYAHPGIGGGFFPVGGYYQGAEIQPLVDAPTLLERTFSSLRPNAKAKKTLKVTPLPGEKQSIDKGLAYLNQLLYQIGLQALSYQSEAAGAVYEYSENDVQYREILLTGIINMPAALTWKNTRTIAFRAPVKDFENWRPVMDIIRFSVRFSPRWFLKESEGQEERARIIQKVYEEIRRIDQEIIQKTTINREEIMNDNFLVLTEQEEYVNPHSGEIEVDTDAYKYRWETPSGDLYYTNREDENPNIFLTRTDYKRTPMRKRRNE